MRSTRRETRRVDSACAEPDGHLSKWISTMNRMTNQMALVFIKNFDSRAMFRAEQAFFVRVSLGHQLTSWSSRAAETAATMPRILHIGDLEIDGPQAQYAFYGKLS